MGTSLPGNGGSSSFQHGMSKAHSDNRMADTIYVTSNANGGNVSNSYNNINVGTDEESLRIYEWLSPLEPHKKHQDVRNHRLDGVGEWVLERSEFQSWRKSRGGLKNTILLCYGAQGGSKTYIRWESTVFSGNNERC